MRRRLRYLLVGLAAAGCNHPAHQKAVKPKREFAVDRCSSIPPGAIPLPIGTFTREPLKRQAEKAEADDFVIYYNEWLDEQTTLGPFGTDHLLGIINRLPFSPYPVVVQPEPERPELNAARMKAVVEALAAAGITDAPARVVSARPAAEGLYGEEAERIYPQLIRGGGASRGGGAGGFNSFGGLGGFGYGGGMGLGGFGGY